MRALDEEAAQIQADDNLTKQQKQAALDYLEGRRKLLQEAQDEELRQLLAHGDELNNDLQERLNEEAKAYADQTAQIIQEFDRATDAKINNAVRAKKKIDEENLSLLNQEQILKRIGVLSGAPPPKVPTVDGSTAQPVTLPNQQVQPQPAPGNSMTDSIIVQQSDTWRVIDTEVVSSLGALGDKISSKLESVISAINSSTSRITGAIGRSKSFGGGIVS